MKGKGKGPNRQGFCAVGANAASGTALRTMVEVARIVGVSRGRVYQLEQRAIHKIRLAIEREAAAAGMTPRQWLFDEE